MADLCHLSPLKCLNNGQCVANISVNTTYCKCNTCYEGTFCENEVRSQRQFDTPYIEFIMSIIELCISILNNSLALELFIRSRRIRRTNCGIYLIVYSILSLLSSIVIVPVYVIKYYCPSAITKNRELYDVFDCYIGEIGYGMLVYLCIWFSLCVAFERGLVICFDGKMNASRWRSCAGIIFMFAVAGGCVTPMMLYTCDPNKSPNFNIVRAFFGWFFNITGVTIYILATLLVLISFALRIRRYGTENGSFIKTFLKLLYTHLFIFIPPIAYVVGYIPLAVVLDLTDRKHSYYQCGISTGEYIVKLLIDRLLNISIAITWLLFVYPSKVYMTEFYLNTWSGQQLAKILIHIKSYY